jgi:DNA helicase-2/ATP-dependent DNA helicase PcrA
VSDASVRAALRSAAALVAIEAPAGCGKTTQGADYARELVAAGKSGRLLILTHTHAACSVFAHRAKGAGARVEIRTIDGVIANIASIYHAGLDFQPILPRGFGNVPTTDTPILRLRSPLF